MDTAGQTRGVKDGQGRRDCGRGGPWPRGQSPADADGPREERISVLGDHSGRMMSRLATQVDKRRRPGPPQEQAVSRIQGGISPSLVRIIGSALDAEGDSAGKPAKTEHLDRAADHARAGAT